MQFFCQVIRTLRWPHWIKSAVTIVHNDNKERQQGGEKNFCKHKNTIRSILCMADSQKKHTQTCSYRRETCRVTTFLLICQESKSRRPGLSFCWKTNDTNPAVNVIACFGLGFFFSSPRSIWISVRNIPGNMRALFF